MNASIHLGRIGSIKIRAHWSVFVIGALIAWLLAAGELPAEAPGYPTDAYWLVAVLATVVFFASLLLHELAHAAVARRHGIAVDTIVLWLLGGVAELQGEPPDGKSELRMAIAGPATSLALGIGLGEVAWIAWRFGAAPLLVAALAWLGAINAVLAVFNMLPAFPLDGGRVLRAILWTRSGDERRATVTAAHVARVIGTAMMVLGVLAFLTTDVGFDGLWIAMIGWFVYAAAGAESRATVERSAVSALTARDAMVPTTVAVPAYATVAHAVDDWVRPHRLLALPVIELDGRVSGLLTLDQIQSLARDRWNATAVREIAWATDELVFATPDDPLAPLGDRMRRAPSHHALVFDHGRLVGTISPSDIAHAARFSDLARPFASSNGPWVSP